VRRIPFLLISGLAVAVMCKTPRVSLEARGQGGPAQAVNPSAAAKYYERGLAHAQKGEDDQALEDLKRAIELDPNRFEPYKALDDLLSKKSDWKTIIDYWTQFLALQPNNAQAHVERGGTFTHTREYVRALEDYKKACSLGDQEGCQLANRCAEVVAARNRATTTPPPQEGWGSLRVLSLLMAVALLAMVAAIPVLVIVWLVSYFRSRSRAAALPQAVPPPQSQVATLQWQLPPELSVPGHRSVRTKARVVLTLVAIPIIFTLGCMILLGDSKPVRELYAQLAQGHLDTQGVFILPFVILMFSYPVTFALRAIAILSKSWTLLRDGQAAGGTVTGIARSGWGLSIHYKFSTELGMSIEGKSTLFLPGQSQVPRVGQPVAVLYDRQNPQENTLYPTEAYELAA
jgi:tetratricopeptide (TPR) repeat protein